MLSLASTCPGTLEVLVTCVQVMSRVSPLVDTEGELERQKRKTATAIVTRWQGDLSPVH